MKFQPAGFYLLNFASMWECFSYYGMRALLVLFMVKEMNLSDSEAYATYALYITLVELGGVLGGIIADRFISLQGAIFMGGWAIFCGHLLLGFSQTIPSFFFLGLGLIVAGTNLFRVNIPAAIGALYHQDENNRERGFTIFYATINIGGLLATIICGILGESYGWHLGFGAAAIGMLFGNFALLLRWNIRKILSFKKVILGISYILSACLVISLALSHAKELNSYVSFLLGSVFIFVFRNIFKNDQLKKLFQLLIFLILFYACEELLGSSLVLYAERHVDRVLGGFEIPSSMISMVNPLVILIGGAFVANFKGSTPNKIRLSLLLLGLAFVIFYVTAISQNIPLLYVAGGIGMISIGELFIGPTIFAESAKLSKDNERGTTMSIVTLGYSAANLFSGFFSQKMAVDVGDSSSFAFQEGFKIIAILVFTVLLLSFIFMRSYVSQVDKVCKTSS